jgi:hypothetical protein
MDQTTERGAASTMEHGMTSTTQHAAAPTTERGGEVTTERVEQAGRVRAVLLANAAVTGACGAVMLAAGGWLADAAEVERVWVTGIAAFFLVLALAVAALASGSARTAITTARLLAVADAGWTLATVGVVVAGALALTGALLALAVAVVTAGFAVAEHRAARTARPAPALVAR